MRRGFTIIELLIVITIVVILVGLLVAGASAVRKASLRTRSEAIVGSVANALAAAVGERKSLPIVPHPLASTSATRLSFVRGAIDPIRLDDDHAAIRGTTPAGPPNLGSANPNLALWSKSSAWTPASSVPTGGMGILGSEDKQFIANVPNERLLDNDVFAATNAPIAFGAKRGLLGVLGITDDRLHSYLACPAVDRNGSFRNRITGSTQLQTAVTTANYPELVHAPKANPSVASWWTDQEEAVKRALESAWGELGKLQALRTPSRSATAVWGSRFCWDPTINANASTWKPGFLNSGGWKTVSLYGTSVVDAYGNEIFVSRAGDGRIRVLSAGADGCLRVNPGANAVINTTITPASCRLIYYGDTAGAGDRGDGLGGDDLDGTRDNLASGVEVDDYLDKVTASEATHLGL